MRGWSFPFGKVFGVELRVHLFIFLLLAITMAYGAALDHSASRGIGLWLMMLAAIAVREITRCMAFAWWGLKLQRLLFVPTGAMPIFAPGDASEHAATPLMQRRLVLIGPLANILFALTLAGLIVTITPHVDLLARPWVVPGHLLRAFVWVNFMLGLLHLTPAIPLDGGRFFRADYIQKHGTSRGLRTATSTSQWIAFSLMLSGLVFNNIWFTMMGSFVFVGAQLEDPGILPDGPEGSSQNTVKMRDVMMLEYSTLSASDTLEDALERSIHVLQDVFPVVRGASMVGAVSRQSIVEALAANGNGYVQGVMTRTLQSAHPDDSLVQTLRRVMLGSGAQLLPVMVEGRVVGIITPQNLSHSMSVLSRSRRFRAPA